MYKNIIKRLLDIMCALAAFIFLWPLFVIVAILVKINLGSPVIFKQARPGKNGELFTIYKFRTMKIDKDMHGNDAPDSTRLTPFGQKLRKSSLDEIPEALNILKGDMSVVGPRPLLVKDYVFFSDEIKHRQDVKPGLSGLAQVKGRNNVSWERKFEYDLDYCKNISFFKDIKIVFQTIFKAFVKKDGVDRDGFVTDENYGDYLLRTKQIDADEYKMKIIDSYIYEGLYHNRENIK